MAKSGVSKVKLYILIIVACADVLSCCCTFTGLLTFWSQRKNRLAHDAEAPHLKAPPDDASGLGAPVRRDHCMTAIKPRWTQCGIKPVLTEPISFFFFIATDFWVVGQRPWRLRIAIVITEAQHVDGDAVTTHYASAIGLCGIFRRTLIALERSESLQGEINFHTFANWQSRPIENEYNARDYAKESSANDCRSSRESPYFTMIT